MSSRLIESLDLEPVIDVHEHHLPETLLDREVNLLRLFEESYAGWTVRRPYPLEEESSPPPRRGDPTTWERLAPYLEERGTNAFVRCLVEGIADLHGLDSPRLTRENWEAVDASVRRRHSEPGFQREVLERGRIEWVITDPYTDPILDPRETLGENYRSVLRINSLAMGWHPEAVDHNGISAHRLAARLGQRVDTWDRYLDFLEYLVVTLPDRGQVALKNALAYDRSCQFDPPREDLARECWGQTSPGERQRQAFGDFVVDRLCRLAAEHDVPVQTHLGTARIRGSHPMRIAPLIERHPRTRFLLMHLAYPWSRDLLGMAFVYRNIWLDLTWSFLLSPSHFRLALDEAIDILPDESRMMLGGDNWHLEETHGAIRQARRLIGEVLEARCKAGFTQEEALRLGRKILHQNAREFFRLPDRE